LLALHVRRLTAGAGFDDTAQLLIERGADPMLATDDGSTPLHWAAFYGHVPCVQLLLMASVPVDVCDAEGSTPLQKAAFNGHTRCVQLLMEHNANVNGMES
jgi:ankyrin repeat protein